MNNPGTNMRNIRTIMVKQDNDENIASDNKCKTNISEEMHKQNPYLRVEEMRRKNFNN